MSRSPRYAWVVYAEHLATVPAQSTGTLEQAISFALFWDVSIILTDTAGFTQGRVKPNGDWDLEWMKILR